MSKLRTHHAPLTIVLSALAILLLGACAGPAGEGEGEAAEGAADMAAEGADATSYPAAGGSSGAAASHGSTGTPAGTGTAAGQADDDGMSGDADVPAVPEGMVVVPAGQEITITLLDKVSTEDAQPGDRVRGEIETGFMIGDKKVPAGRWTLMGQVVSVTPPTRKGDQPGELEIDFDSIKTDDNQKLPVVGYVTAFAGDARNRNIGVIAGAAAVGAILGKAKGGDTKDAVVGAAVGAAAGAGVVRALPGKHLTMEKGDQLTVTLVEDALMPYRQR